MDIAFLVLPVFLTILCGWALAASGLLPADQWRPIETLSFRLLIPAVLILAIAGSDLSVERFGTMVAALVGTLFVLALILLVARQVISPERMDNPTFTTQFQSATRWNGFVVLAVAEQAGGAEGVLLVAVAMAVLIPLINVLNIVVLATYGPGQTSLRSILLTIAKNPLVQGCAIGLLLNLSGLTLPQPVAQTLDFIGRAALAIGLLAIGAGISLPRLIRGSTALVIGLFLRPIFAPAILLLIAHQLGVSGLPLLISALVFAAPAASNGYVVARQMGGNAELYADLMTWQTLLGVLVMPVWLYLLD